MSVWELRGPWGAVRAAVREDGRFHWKAHRVDNRILMNDLLRTARSEYPDGSGWLEAGVYVPDLLGEAVRRVAEEFDGARVLVQRDPPAPPGVVF